MKRKLRQSVLRARIGTGAHMDRVTLVGLDFGSTTTSMLVASAALAANCVTGRVEFAQSEIVYRPPPVFTPFDGDRLQIDGIASLLDRWFVEARIDSAAIFAGGAIVTGLAARQPNAAALREFVTLRVGEAIFATADDPRLESWLAFMGSAAALSRARPDRAILNLDIGGGTTNPALGRDANVEATGCIFIGARHIRFQPGTYQISGLSEFGELILAGHGIASRAGDELSPDAVASIVGYFVSGLEALVSGDTGFFTSPLGQKLQQSAFGFDAAANPIVTFSGGVGELIYAAAANEELPPTTCFGDLGIDLARAILASPRLSRDVACYVPETKGRATVQGLTLHSTDISGTTLFLQPATALPLRDLPVIACLPVTANADQIKSVITRVRGIASGVCIQLVSGDAEPELEAIRAFGMNLGAALSPEDGLTLPPIVLLTTANIGRAIGNYATQWRKVPHNLIVIDEIPLRRAQFVNIGRPRHGVVPVSFYGMS